MSDTADKLQTSAVATESKLLPDALSAESMSSIGNRLRAAGIPLTLQRLAIAEVMFHDPVHVTADQVLSRVRDFMPEISRATVYNTLKLFSEKGLVREIIVDAERVVFDSTVSPHYHFYDMDTGEVTDVPADEIKVVGAPNLPLDFELDEIDVVVRIRRRKP